MSASGAGAASGELAAKIIYEQLYSKDKDGNPVKLSELSEADKQNISALAQLASGLAVAAGSHGNIADTGTAIAGSKNAVENNFLGPKDQKRLMELREKAQNKTISKPEILEMWALDGADQKGDFLAEKYYKDPESLTAPEREILKNYLVRYYTQVQGMSGE